MRKTTLRRSALASAIAALITTGTLQAQVTEPVPEPAFSVYDQLEREQSAGAVAMTPEGGSLLVWKEYDGTRSRLLARRVMPSSRQVPQVIEVAPDALAPQAIRIALASDGSWAVAWADVTSEEPSYDVYARRFDAQDQPLGDVFRVNDFADGGQMVSSLGLAPAGGDLVAAWYGLGPEGDHALFLRRLPSMGAPGDELRINRPGTQVGATSSLVLAGDGDAIVAWSGERDAGDGTQEVLMRRFGPSGYPLTGISQISDPGGAPETNPQLARDAAGLFALAWQVDNRALRLQRVMPDLLPHGLATDVARDVAEDLTAPVLAAEAHGRVVLGFHSGGAPGWEAGTYLERFELGGGAFSYGRQRIWGVWDTPDFRPVAMAGDADGDVTLFWNGTEPGSEIPRAYYRRIAGFAAHDLALSISSSERSVEYGAPFAYVVGVTHRGAPGGLPGEGAASGFLVDVTLPEGAQFDRIHSMYWNCNGPAPYLPPVVQCQFDRALAPGTSAYPIVVYAFAPHSWTTMTGTAELRPWLHPDLDASNDVAYADTYVGDISPDAFTIPTLSGVARGSSVVSTPVQVSGFNVPVTIGVWEGEYSIDGGPFTSEEGTVEAYAQVRVRHYASTEWSGSSTTSLFVGDQRASFTSITQAQDTVPDAFAFVDRVDVARVTTMVSNVVVLGGFNDAAPIAVQGGSYSLNGAPFTSQPGTARNGDNVRVQHRSGLLHGTRTDTVLTVGGVSDTFSSTTLARDVTPDAFAFAAQANVPRGSERTSNEVTIAGINDAAAVTVSGGGYSIDGGPFTSAPGSIVSGQRLRLRHTAASGFGATTSTTVTVGTANVSFTSTTEAQDAVPDAFAFADQGGLATAVEVTSAPIAVSGINVAAAVSVAGGSYSVNGGPFTTAAGTVVAGDQVRVRHVSSSSANTAVTTTLTIGGVSDGFSSTTGATDNTPNAFAFADVTGAQRNKTVTSAPVTVSGINVAVPISVSGGGARWSKNGGAYTTAAGTVVAGDVVRLQVSMPNLRNHTVNVQVAIGALADTWSVTTAP